MGASDAGDAHSKVLIDGSSASLIGREAVLGYRSPMAFLCELTQLFEAGWSENPNDRPSADTIVSVLTSLSKDDLD